MLVNCVAYKAGSKLADISIGEIHLFVNERDCFVWVALQDPEPAEIEVMQREFGLHELAVEDTQHGHQRPKIEEYGDSLFVVLHMIEAEGEELAVGEVNIFVGANYVFRCAAGRAAALPMCARGANANRSLHHGAG